MLKKLRISTLALAAALAVAAPTLTFAQDRDGRRDDHRDVARVERRDDHRIVRGGDRSGFRFSFGINVAPAAGYYDQFGVWHPYGYYDQFGVWHVY